MKLATVTGLVLLMSTGYALAGPGSGEPRSPTDPASGRPSAILDEAKCAEIWSLAQSEGDSLSEGQAAPFVVNFDQVDADGDGKITEAEFQEGCKQGFVQEAAAGQQQPSGESVPEAGAEPQELPESGGEAESDTMPQ